MIKLKVNGVDQEFDGDPNMPCSGTFATNWAARHQVRLRRGALWRLHRCTSTAPRCACVTAIGDAEGAEVTTIERLSAEGNHPVQVAWREINVPQCGFCQTGQIMQAASLLAENKAPTDAQIHEAMAGNVCRSDATSGSSLRSARLPRERDAMLHYLNQQIAPAARAVGERVVFANVEPALLPQGNGVGGGAVIAAAILPFSTAKAYETYPRTAGSTCRTASSTTRTSSSRSRRTAPSPSWRIARRWAPARAPACRWWSPTRWRPTGRG